MTYIRARLVSLVLMAIGGLPVVACDAPQRPVGELRFRTDSFVVRVSPETLPTRAQDQIVWRVTVHDIITGMPIQGGQGRVFATSKDRKSIANGLAESGELGTYRTTLMYVTAGMWAMALEFRRDSTQRLQRTEDWTQDILAGDQPGEIATPPATTKRRAPAT